MGLEVGRPEDVPDRGPEAESERRVVARVAPVVALASALTPPALFGRFRHGHRGDVVHLGHRKPPWFI